MKKNTITNNLDSSYEHIANNLVSYTQIMLIYTLWTVNHHTVILFIYCFGGTMRIFSIHSKSWMHKATKKHLYLQQCWPKFRAEKTTGKSKNYRWIETKVRNTRILTTIWYSSHRCCDSIFVWLLSVKILFFC